MDLSGNDNVGTISGTTAWSADKFGSCVYFTNGKIDCGHPHSLQISDKISIVFLFRIDSMAPGDDNSNLYSKDGQLAIFIRGAGGAIRYLYVQNGVDWSTVTSGYALTIGVWYHVVVTWANAVSPACKIYINGSMANSGNPTDFVAGAGNVCWGNVSELNSELIGPIDHAAIYNRILPAEEIQLLYREPFYMFNQRDKVWPYSGAAIVTYPRNRVGFKPIRGADRLRGLRHIT